MTTTSRLEMRADEGIACYRNLLAAGVPVRGRVVLGAGRTCTRSARGSDYQRSGSAAFQSAAQPFGGPASSSPGSSQSNSSA
jgi:hypothetical protein